MVTDAPPAVPMSEAAERAYEAWSGSVYRGEMDIGTLAKTLQVIGLDQWAAHASAHQIIEESNPHRRLSLFYDALQWP